MTQAIPTPRYNRDIDALRGVAIALVFSYHIGWVSFIPRSVAALLTRFNGGVGVDIFFVISGYLVTGSLLGLLARNHGEVWPTLKKFFAQRWFRTIIPAVIWVLIWMAVSSVSPILGGSLNNLYHGAAAILQLAHLYIFYGCTVSSHCGIFGYYWTLSLEEWFYLALPCLVAFTSRRVSMGLVVAATIAFFWAVEDRFRMWGSMRVGPMLIGVFIQLNRDRVIAAMAWAGSRIWLWLVTLPLAVGMTALWANTDLSQTYILVTGSCAGLFLLALPGKGYLMGTGWLQRGFAALGKVSFSVYLVHVPLIWIVAGLFPAPHTALSMMAAEVTLALGVAGVSVGSYLWLELPCRALGYRVSAGIGRPAGAALMGSAAHS